MPMEHSGNSIEGSVIGGSRVTLEEAPRAPQTYVRSVTFRMKSTEYSRRLPAARIASRGGKRGVAARPSGSGGVRLELL